MTLHTNLSFETATGSIDYPFTNDYMFRAILQKDKQVLKALIAALLHLEKESIHDVVITNPIELGAAISDKDFILDIRVNLNNEQLIDLEMQMSNEYNWSERSISYAARSFDQLNSGEEYKEVLPVHGIGFLNFTLFEDQPEFFATYELRNKNAKIKRLEDTIVERDNTIAENQKLLAEKDAELLRLQKELAKLKQL